MFIPNNKNKLDIGDTVILKNPFYSYEYDGTFTAFSLFKVISIDRYDNTKYNNNEYSNIIEFKLGELTDDLNFTSRTIIVRISIHDRINDSISDNSIFKKFNN